MPAITQAISALPPVPTTSSPSNFDVLADAFLAAFPQLRTEINTFKDQANALAIGSVYGQRYTYLAAVTNTDPTAGKLKFDNANLALATKLYLSETDADGNNMAAMLATWDDNVQLLKGQLRVIKASTPTVYADFNVTGALTDNGAWDAFSLGYIGGNGALADQDPVVLQFQRAGADGASVVLTSPTRSVTVDGAVTAADNGYNIDVANAGRTLAVDTPAAMAGSSVFFYATRFGVLLTGTFYNVLDGTASAQTRAVPRGTAAVLTSDGTALRLELIAPTSIFSQLQDVNYSTQLVDAGCDTYHTVGIGNTYTINGALAYPVGTVLSFTNLSAAVNVTIAIATDTLRQGGTTNTGPRTLAPFSTATARKVAAGVWVITGAGLT